MADRKPTTFYYQNLGGVNLKSSEYKLNGTQWLDLRNVDFDVPNALQKRPGSTQAVMTNTSGPVISLFEYKKLTGQSFIIAGTDTALFYLQANAFTLLDTGWTNGQPQDMLTFLNKLWIASGQNYKSWDGNTLYQAGLPCPLPANGASLPAGTIGNIFTESVTNFGETVFTVGGATVSTPSASFIARAVFLAYSYQRADGYNGPLDFLSTARNIISYDAQASGAEFFTYYYKTFGFTTPSGVGVTAINIWIGVDTITRNSSTEDIPGVGRVRTGNLGWQSPRGGPLYQGYVSATLKPTADLNRFHLYTTIPVSNLFSQIPAIGGNSLSFWGTTIIPLFSDFDKIATGSLAFTGVPFCWFNTNTPKYIDVNQNVMFMSGFSNAPSDMWFSDIGAPESIQPDYQFEVRTNDGDRIMGHKAYNNTVLVFKEESFHKVIGSTPEDFQLVELSTEFGALSNDAIIEYNEKLLFLDRKGIVQYDGAGWRVISDQIDDIFRRMNLNAAKEFAVGIHHNYRNQVWFGIPVDGSTKNNLTVVFDYLINAWTFFDGFNASSFAMIKGSEPKPTAWRGSPSGMVYYHSESFLGDNGQGISCVPFSRFEQFEGENSTNVWRRLFLDVGAVSGGVTGVINGAVFTDYDKSTVKATFSMYQNVFQSKAEIGVVGKAVAIQFSHFSASLPLLLNGYAWSKRNLRNV